MKAHAQFIVAAVMFVLCGALGSIADKVVGRVIVWVAASAETRASSNLTLR